MTDARVAVVIEDDLDARELTQLVLTQSGFTVYAAPDGPAGIEAVRQHEPILTTLDVQMPGMDGFAVAKRLREFSLTYLIMITSRASEIDVIQGFEAGADDYLVKPFRPRELRARADSMLRRPRERADVTPVDTSWAAQLTREMGEHPASDTGQQPTPAPVPASLPSLAPTVARGRLALPDGAPTAEWSRQPAPSSAPAGPAAGSLLTFAGLTLDSTSGRATLEDRELELSGAELDLLSTLMRTGRRVRSRADLVLAMRGDSDVTSHFVNEADKRVVDSCLASLRCKLGDEGEPPRLIEPIKGVGYRMAATG